MKQYIVLLVDPRNPGRPAIRDLVPADELDITLASAREHGFVPAHYVASLEEIMEMRHHESPEI